MSGLFSRMKGKRVERDMVALVKRVFPDARRGFQSRSGRDACDVEGTPYHIEVKGGKCPNPRAALKQAIEDTDGRTPVVIVKDDRCEPFVVMRLQDWLDDLWHDKRVLEAKASAFHGVEEARDAARTKAMRWLAENGNAVLAAADKPSNGCDDAQDK